MKQQSIQYYSNFPNKTPEMAWTGRRTNTTKPVDLKTAVWSGRWNTTFGAIELNQVGSIVSGKYKDVGYIEGTFNKESGLLKGTFTNDGKMGYYEFKLSGNNYSGRWGWNPSMTGGKWDGTKLEKVNSQSVVSSSTSTTSSALTDSDNEIVTDQNSSKATYRIYLNSINVPTELEGTMSISNPLLHLYGFVGVKVFRVTNSGREEIKSFGQKSQYFFNRDEDHAFSENRERIYLPETPANYRDFYISTTDIANPNVAIEVELWHHLKGKRPGINADYGKTRQTLTLAQLLAAQNAKGYVEIGASCEVGILQNRNNSTARFNVKRIQ